MAHKLWAIIIYGVENFSGLLNNGSSKISCGEFIYPRIGVLGLAQWEMDGARRRQYKLCGTHVRCGVRLPRSFFGSWWEHDNQWRAAATRYTYVIKLYFAQSRHPLESLSRQYNIYIAKRARYRKYPIIGFKVPIRQKKQISKIRNRTSFLPHGNN